MTRHGPDDQVSFRYDARLAASLELTWQRRWAEDGTFNAPNPVGALAAGFEGAEGKQKAYVLDFFPHPSGVGLHVGHPLGYIGTDVVCRFLRMTGHTVLHAFGYDAFGLPAEQYAISTGQHPAVTTRANIDNIRGQLLRLGLGYDTRREFATSDPSFYRWTQWIFLQIFNAWYDQDRQRARPVAELIAEFENGTRAPTGEANPDGRPWAELDPVTRRRVVDGWRLAYVAQELVNWAPGLGTVLANEEVTADGRSDVGNYPVYRRPLRQWLLRITAYAERLLAGLDDLDWPEPIKRQQRNWIGPSDGAVIGFPVTGRDGLIIEAFTTRPDTLPGATYLVLAPEHPLATTLAGGAWPAGTPLGWRYGRGSPAEAVRAYQQRTSAIGDRQRTAARDKTGVFTGSYAVNPATAEPIPVLVADYVLTGQGTGAIMAVPADDERDEDFARALGLPATGYEPIEDPVGWLEATGHGRRMTTYRLRDWLFSRQRYWGEPFPIVYDADGLPVALPEDLLPVTLLEMTDFAATASADEHAEPVPPLARVPGWAVVELDLGEGPRTYRRELNTMPQWAGSCWYYLRYLDPGNDLVFVDPANERYWMVPAGAAPGDGGVDLYVGGVEHAVLHLLYARFWHKVLFDLGLVSTTEPFRRLVNQGYVIAPAYTDTRGMYVPADEVTGRDGGYAYRGQPVTRRLGKMGKSLKNSVTPDEVIAAYGADTLRLYEMSMGPLEADRPWQTGDIVGVHRFLQRLWRGLVDERTGELTVGDDPAGDDTRRLLHRTISAVRGHYADLRFNVAIARLQELVSHVARVSAEAGSVPREVAEPLVLMIAPLAPHVAEELWARLGHAESVAHAAFPRADPELAAEATVVLPVQVNGKTRLRIEAPADASEEQIGALLAGHEEIARHVAGAEIDRVVIVPGRIVNVVTR
ncbi:MAG TPA: class I tRNA ligase family protein [Trebonia sp.]